MLKLNLVETIFWWFYGPFTSISLMTRALAWLIVVLKLADDSDIAQIIISDSSKSKGKQTKVPFCRNHGCFGGLWFHWKWTSARQKYVFILQFIDTLKSVANPSCSCFSCSFNIPSLVSGKRFCFRTSSRCIESYLTRIWEGFQIELFAYISSTSYRCYSSL